MNMEKTGGFLRPAVPAATHQRVTGWLFTEMTLFAREEGCQVMVSPFAVYLNGDEGECLLPDITVMRHEDLMDEEGCHGAPDLVVEVVSPDSRAHDYGGKLAAYIRGGVREYWAVDPERETIVVYGLESPDVPVVCRFGDNVCSIVFPDLIVDSAPLREMRCRRAGSGRQEGPGTGAVHVGFTGGAQEFPGQQECRSAQAPGVQEGKAAQVQGSQEEKAVHVRGSQEGKAAHVPGAQEDCSAKAPESHSASVPGNQELPEQLGVEEVRAYLEEHFGELVAARNKGPIMKAAMGALKGKADSRLLSEVVAEICRSGTI